MINHDRKRLVRGVKRVKYSVQPGGGATTPIIPWRGALSHKAMECGEALNIKNSCKICRGLGATGLKISTAMARQAL